MTKLIALALVIVLVLGGTATWAAADTPAPPPPQLNFPPVGGLFADSTGLIWRVLHEDGNGNRLIITEEIQIALWYATLPDVRWVPFAQSNLRAALNGAGLAPEIAANALMPLGIGTDVRSTLGNFNAEENEPAGLTSAGPRATVSQQGLFILSISEANEYFADDEARQAYGGASWWLRSPGNTGALTATTVLGSGAITLSQSFMNHGLRPALWVDGTSVVPPCCDLYPDCTCDEQPCCDLYPDCNCDEPPCCDLYPDCNCDEPPCCDLYPDCRCDEPPCCNLYPDCNCDEQPCCPEYPACTCPEFHAAYMFGDPYGNFHPRDSITRAEVAVILARTHIEGYESNALPPGMTSFPFNDIAAHWARFYIAWAYDANLIRGYAGNFSPNEFITRQELAAVLARARGDVRPAGINPFFDADTVCPWAANYVYTVYRAGVMVGDDHLNFNPQNPISRAEVATAVNRMLGRIDSQRALGLAELVNANSARSFPDVADTAWYFPSVLAAANDHYLTRNEDGTINWKKIVQ